MVRQKWSNTMLFIMWRKKNRGRWIYGISSYPDKASAEKMIEIFSSNWAENEYKIV
jgi:hypothetical protein